MQQGFRSHRQKRRRADRSHTVRPRFQSRFRHPNPLRWSRCHRMEARLSIRWWSESANRHPLFRRAYCSCHRPVSHNHEARHTKHSHCALPRRRLATAHFPGHFRAAWNGRFRQRASHGADLQHAHWKSTSSQHHRNPIRQCRSEVNRQNHPAAKCYSFHCEWQQ